MPGNDRLLWAVEKSLAHTSTMSGRMQALIIYEGFGSASQILLDRGFKGDLDGIECNKAALDAASKKGIFRNLIHHVVTPDPALPFEDETYDIVICTSPPRGGCIQAQCITDFFRILKVGGTLMLDILDFNSEYNNRNCLEDANKVLDENLTNGRSALIETAIFQEEAQHELRCYKKIKSRNVASAEAWKLMHSSVDHSKIYTEWAENYDTDIMRVYGCDSKKELVKRVLDYADNADLTMLLDVAAGTGIIGDMLLQAGYKGIMDGLEASDAMLKMAEKKGVYRNYICFTVDPEEDLPIKDSTYDVVTIAGALFPHHIEAAGLRPIAKTLKTGGIMVFYARTTGDFMEYGNQLKTVMSELVNDGEIKVVEQSDILQYRNKKEGEEDIKVVLCVCRKL